MMAQALWNSPAKAQAFDIPTDNGLWQVSVEPTKTTFIGAYGQYVAPVIARDWARFWGGGGGGGGGGGSSGNNTKFGPIVGDLRWNYAGAVGWRAALMYQPTAVKLWNGLSPQILFSCFHDSNALRAFAPNGVGVFRDPTHGYGQAEIYALEEEIRLPLYAIRNETGLYSFLIGQGWMWEWSHSYALVTSASLDLTAIENISRVAPTFSLTSEWRPTGRSLSFLDLPGGAKFSGLDVSLSALKTEYMWTVGAYAALVWRL
jgi:hypothetical protein